MVLGSDDLAIFFDDFSDACTLPGGSIVNVIFDVTDQEALGGRVIAGDYVIMGKASDLSALKKNDLVTIKAKQYQVQKVLPAEDGEVSEVYLAEKFI